MFGIKQQINSSLSDHSSLIISTSFSVQHQGGVDSSQDFYTINIHRYNLSEADKKYWRRFYMTMDNREWSSVNRHKARGKSNHNSNSIG